MLNVNKSLLVLALIISTNLFAQMSKPIPICSNVYKLTAYKITKNLTNKCNAVGIKVNFNNVYNQMKRDVTEQNAFSCNTSCLLMSGSTDMATCVENKLVDPFVSDFMNNTNGRDPKFVCNIVKSWKQLKSFSLRIFSSEWVNIKIKIFKDVI